MRSALLLIALGVGACGASKGGPRGTPEPPRAPPAEPEPLSVPFRVLSPAEPVPDFRLRTEGGHLLESKAWLGTRAFVVVFFSTWCQVCEMKLPLVKQAVAPHPDLPVVLVSLDDADTWTSVPAFVRRFGLGQTLVRGSTFPRFSLAYAPLQTVPVVAVIGRNGHLVDYQVGYSPRHGPRLAAAIELAVRMPPDAPPFLESPDREPPDL